MPRPQRSAEATDAAALQSLQRRRCKITAPAGRMPQAGWRAVEQEWPWLHRCSTCLGQGQAEEGRYYSNLSHEDC